MTSSTLTTSLDQSSTSLNVWSIQRESTRPSHRLQPLDDSAAPNELIDTDEGQNEPVSDAKELSEKPPGAPFPAKLIVAHRWDIGQKYYECIKYLIDWINAKLADPKSLGESFMEEGGSTKKFIDIWPAFFQKMVKEETMGLVERLQTGLKVPKSASRIKGCLHFEYGVGAPGIFAAIKLITNLCKNKNVPLDPIAFHQLVGIEELLALPHFPTETIEVPFHAETHKHGLLDLLDPELRAVHPYAPYQSPSKPGHDQPAKNDHDIPAESKEREPFSKEALTEYLGWRKHTCRGIRTSEDLPWAPSLNQMGVIAWEFGLGSIASKSMLTEFCQIHPKHIAPFFYEVSGVPLPMEWDYTSQSPKDLEGIPLLQHFVDESELPDVLFVDDPDELVIPTDVRQMNGRGRGIPSASSEENISAMTSAAGSDVNEQGDDTDQSLEGIQEHKHDDDNDGDTPFIMPSNDSSTIHPIVNTENQQEEITVASDHIVADPIPCPPSALRPIRYKRVDPWGIGVPFCELPPPAIARAPAYLTLTKTAAIGTGHSARVWDAVIEFDRRIDSSLSTSAPAELPSPDAPIVHESITGTKLPPKLSVAAKIPYTADDARDFVLNEARIYSTLPPDLTRTFSGYTMPPRARKWQATATVAVAPKFYGYYMPDNEDGKNADRKPILLMEKCGKPVEIPSDSERSASPMSEAAFENERLQFKLNDDHRELLFSMLQRLHSSGFTQNSFSPRNILYQPGPLVLPPSQRSNRTPSFRIIDFGRGVCRFREVKRSQRMMSPEQEEERVALSLFRMRDF